MGSGVKVPEACMSWMLTIDLKADLFPHWRNRGYFCGVRGDSAGSLYDAELLTFIYNPTEGTEASPVGVGGDSAGGCIAASVAHDRSLQFQVSNSKMFQSGLFLLKDRNISY